jgi:acylphosphatase
MKSRVHITIYGRVQGVGFRFNTKIKSLMNNIQGWVKNNPDKTVEIIAEGEKENLKKLISFCNKGPFMARVEDIKVEWLKYQEEFTTFSIKY